MAHKLEASLKLASCFEGCRWRPLQSDRESRGYYQRLKFPPWPYCGGKAVLAPKLTALAEVVATRWRRSSTSTGVANCESIGDGERGQTGGKGSERCVLASRKLSPSLPSMTCAAHTRFVAEAVSRGWGGIPREGRGAWKDLVDPTKLQAGWLRDSRPRNSASNTAAETD